MRNISEKLVEKTDRYVDYDLQTGPKSEAWTKADAPSAAITEWHLSGTGDQRRPGRRG